VLEEIRACPPHKGNLGGQATAPEAYHKPDNYQIHSTGAPSVRIQGGLIGPLVPGNGRGSQAPPKTNHKPIFDIKDPLPERSGLPPFSSITSPNLHPKIVIIIIRPLGARAHSLFVNDRICPHRGRVYECAPICESSQRQPVATAIQALKFPAHSSVFSVACVRGQGTLFCGFWGFATFSPQQVFILRFARPKQETRSATNRFLFSTADRGAEQSRIALEAIPAQRKGKK